MIIMASKTKTKQKTNKPEREETVPSGDRQARAGQEEAEHLSPLGTSEPQQSYL